MSTTECLAVLFQVFYLEVGDGSGSIAVHHKSFDLVRPIVGVLEVDFEAHVLDCLLRVHHCD